MARFLRRIYVLVLWVYIDWNRVIQKRNKLGKHYFGNHQYIAEFNCVYYAFAIHSEIEFLIVY